MKNIYFTGKILIIFFIACLLQSCNNDGSSLANEIRNRNGGNYAINLFPNSDTVGNHTDKLSFQEAFAKSSFVFRASYIKKVDSSYRQGAPVFYIYQAFRGNVQKAPSGYRENKNDTTIFLLSQEKLFKGTTVNDSVYLFLEPLTNYNLLRKDMKIQYHWVTDAPFER